MDQWFDDSTENGHWMPKNWILIFSAKLKNPKNDLFLSFKSYFGCATLSPVRSPVRLNEIDESNETARERIERGNK